MDPFFGIGKIEDEPKQLQAMKLSNPFCTKRNPKFKKNWLNLLIKLLTLIITSFIIQSTKINNDN